MNKTTNDVYVDVATISRAFDCTQTYLTKMKGDGLIVQPKRGEYDLVESTRLYITHLRDKSGKTITDGKVIDFHEEKARLTKMQADKAEMEVEELAGQLVRVDDVLDQWQNILADVKGKLLAIPSKLATLVADISNPAEAQELIDDYVREALQELSDYDRSRKSTANSDSGNESPNPAPKAKNKRVGRPRKKA